MRRATISLFSVLLALLAVGIVVSAVGVSSAALAETPVTQPPHKLIGYAGKIIAVKPPGDWTQGGLASSVLPLIPNFPLVLPIFGTDVHIASSNETFMASDPANPLYFISGSNAVSRDFSSDGGQTWTVTSPSGIGDPVGTYDAAGNAYFGQLSTGTCPDPVVVSRSANGGQTWGSQVQALTDAAGANHFIDKPWMAADKTASSPYYGRVYVTGTSFYAPGCNLNAYVNDRVVVAYSTDQGTTWSASSTLSDASHDQDQFTNPTIASDGTLYVSYQYQNCTYNCTSSLPMVQLLAKSTDGGVTFSPSMTITGQVITPTGAFSGGYQYLYAGSTSNGFRHNDQAIIGVSPTNPQHVYAVWTDGRFESSFVYQSVTGQHADVVFSRSTDGGTTWSPVSKINDDNMQGKDQFFPWMTVGSDGTLHVSWMDRREAAVDGFPYREYYSQSTDEGQTWSTNQPVADVSNTPSTFIGDYSGIAVSPDNSRVLPVWTDQRSGQGIYTDHGIIAGGATPTPTLSPTLPPATDTAVAGTSTPTSTNTPTNTPVADTSTPTASPTSILPTITLTIIPPSETATTVSGTATETATGIPSTATATATETVTGTPPTATETPTACTLAFTDVPNGSTFYTYIECLACRGIINGYPCGGPGEPCDTNNNPYFRPSNNVTRGQFAKIASNSAGFDDPAGEQQYEDVLPGSSFYDFIWRLTNRLLVSGYPCGGPGEPCGSGNLPYFRPNANVTRGQLSKIDSNAAGYSDAPGAQQYEDVLPGSTFYDFIWRLSDRGIINGYPCGGPGEPCGSDNLPYFRPNANATRGQASKIVSSTFFPECSVLQR